MLAEEAHHLPIALDGDALGDEIFLQHVRERRTFLVFAVRVAGEHRGIHLRLAAQLLDALGDLIGVFLLFVRMFEELFLHGLRVNPRGHEVVKLVAQNADELGRERLVEHRRRLVRGRARSPGSPRRR